MNLTIHSGLPLRGENRVPGDKSITHRALLFSALADGPSRISGYLDGADCRATIGCLCALGVKIEQPTPHTLLVHGVGLHGWREPDDVLNCVRSGTTMRLLAGLLAGQPFFSVLSGDTQLRRRPMDRVAVPLRAMGAQIHGRQDGRLPPLTIVGRQLYGREYTLPMASAQVKSSLLLAGLYADGTTIVNEPAPSRDHTERMLRARGVSLVSSGLQHVLTGPVENLAAIDTAVPGDLSSAAYFLVGAVLLPGSEVLLSGVNLNPTRTGLLDVMAAMGATITIQDERLESGEPVGDVLVRNQPLQATTVTGALVPRMIDEFPILALAATQAQGITCVQGAGELRVKETDRIATIVSALGALGARIEPRADGFIVEGPTALRGACVDSYGDHRLAMTLAIAGLLAEGETTILGAECIADSFPGFAESLNLLVPGALQ
jgi:3-phosphoshikimate 1-carboxyvinyltransferase